MLTNNCEHFAYWCVSGGSATSQGRRVVHCLFQALVSALLSIFLHEGASRPSMLLAITIFFGLCLQVLESTGLKTAARFAAGLTGAIAMLPLVKPLSSSEAHTTLEVSVGVVVVFTAVGIGVRLSSYLKRCPLQMIPSFLAHPRQKVYFLLMCSLPKKNMDKFPSRNCVYPRKIRFENRSCLFSTPKDMI